MDGSYPNPSIRGGSVGPDELRTPLAARLTGSLVAVPENSATDLLLNMANDNAPVPAVFDNGGFVAADGGSTATVPRDGYYRVSADVNFDANTSGYREIQLKRTDNGSSVSSNSQRIAPSPLLDTLASATAIFPAATGMTFGVVSRWGNNDATVGESLTATVFRFEIEYLGPLAN